jgi:hypothetical protein
MVCARVRPCCAGGAQGGPQTVVFSKGQVYVHPSLHARDNIAGTLSVVKQVGAGTGAWLRGAGTR